MTESKNAAAPTDQSIDQLAVNTIRTLCDGRGAGRQLRASRLPPMALAPVTYQLWQHHLRFDPELPVWANRDRFVLSAGHASALLYSMLHLAGVKSVNPDYETLGEPAVVAGGPASASGSWTPSARATPSTAGRPGWSAPPARWAPGIATSVGMAIAGLWQAATFNRPGYELFDYDVYALAGDGCLMEGIGAEAASLAGHLKLANLCWIYDNNRITIEGATSLAFSEDVPARFAGYGWAVHHVTDANDLAALHAAFDAFRAETGRPTLIVVDSVIGYGAPHKQGTHAAHGEPLGVDEVKATKRFYGWPEDETFRVPDGGASSTSGPGWASAAARCAGSGRSCSPATPPSTRSRPSSSTTCSAGRCPTAGTPTSRASRPTPRAWPGRDANGKVLNAVAQRVPVADRRLGRPGPVEQVPARPSRAPVTSRAEDRAGRNLHFGVREHAAAAVANGLALSKLRAYQAGFLIFSDFQRGALRLSALMELPLIHVYTHDSIGVGEDGPTHQPIEQLASIRAMPGVIDLRPADGNEVAEAWRVLMPIRHEPVALMLSRQPLPTLDRYALRAGGRRRARGLRAGRPPGRRPGGHPDRHRQRGGDDRGGLRAADRGRDQGAGGVACRRWSCSTSSPVTTATRCCRRAVTARVSVEKGTTFGWDRWVGPTGAIIGMSTFGASAPLKVLQAKFGFTPEHIVATARAQLGLDHDTDAPGETLEESNR